MQKHNLTIRIDQELRARIKEQATSQNISAGEFIRNAIARHLQDDCKAEPKAEEIDQTEWLQNQLEKQLQESANERKMNQRILLELQAEKKALYDEIQQQKSLLEQPKIKLPRFLSFLSSA